MGRTLIGIAGTTAFLLLLAGCRTESDGYRTFADFPEFASYYAGRCADGDPGPPRTEDRNLLMRYRPRFILPPGSIRPISFYRDYLPYSVLRRFSDEAVLEEKVSGEELRRQQDNTQVYLEYRPGRGKQPVRAGGSEKGGPASGGAGIPVVFGRVSIPGTGIRWTISWRPTPSWMEVENRSRCSLPNITTTGPILPGRISLPPRTAGWSESPSTSGGGRRTYPGS